ncbi:MAG: hypothetical protein ACREQZ_15710 [Woeseiaceae bacterium]
MVRRAESRPDGELVVVTGSAGSGKTLFSMTRYGRAARLLVWDSHFEWSAHGAAPVGSLGALAARCTSADPWQLAYTGPANRKTFPVFCRVALCAMKLEPCTVVVEELAEVTHAGKAPDDWGELIRWTRKLGGRLVGITQRPAESDKTLIGNAHLIACHAMSRADDAEYMAKLLRTPVAVVDSLDRVLLERLEWRPDGSVIRKTTRRPAAARTAVASRSV